MAAEFYVYFEEPNEQGKMERHSIKCFDLRDMEIYAKECEKVGMNNVTRTIYHGEEEHED